MATIRSFFFPFLFFWQHSQAYLDLIDTSSPNEFYNKAITCSGNGDCKIICDEENSCAATTITCPKHFLCDITCSGIGACYLTEILCPYGDTCTINCNNERSCQSSTIRSEYASQLTLNDCSDTLSCNGMSIYFPPNNNGYPRATINGGNNLNAINGHSLHFYAIFGWHDLNIINYAGNFDENSNAFMHCLPSYTSTCTLADNAWSCAQSDDVCNAPPTQQPTAAPTFSPTTNPTTLPTLFPTIQSIVVSSIHPTVTPTLQPSIEIINDFDLETSIPTMQMLMSTTEETNELQQGLDHIDILWLVMSLLLSVLCFVLVTLAFYVYNAKHSNNHNIKNNVDNELKQKEETSSNQLFIDVSSHKNKYPTAPIIEEEEGDEVKANDAARYQQPSNLYANGSLNALKLQKLRTNSTGAVSVSQSIAFWNNQQSQQQKLPQILDPNRLRLERIDSSKQQPIASSALQLVLDHSCSDKKLEKQSAEPTIDSESRPSHLVSFNLSTNCNKSANSNSAMSTLNPTSLSTVTASSMMEMHDDSGDETEEYVEENSTTLQITNTTTTESKRRDNEDGVLKMSHFTMIQKEMEQLRDDANSSDDASSSSLSSDSSTSDSKEDLEDGKVRRMNPLENYQRSVTNLETEEEDEYVFDMYDHQRSVTMVVNEKKTLDEELEGVNEEQEDDEMPCVFGGGKGGMSVSMADEHTPYESPFDENKHHTFGGSVAKIFSAYNLMNNPVSQHADDETDEMDTKSTRTMVTKDKHYHDTTHSTLEIQGLINL